MKLRIPLTEQEHRLLEHLLDGHPASLIAELEGLSPSQVRQQLHSALRKLDRGDERASGHVLPFRRNCRSS